MEICMKAFMDKDFMLKNETAKHLFHDYSENLPLIDYHCHISPKEIFEDRRYNDISEVWLGGKNPDGSYFGDHYKWRVMRSNGVDENLITGDAAPIEKFKAFDIFYLMTRGGPANSTKTLMYDTYLQAFTNLKYSEAATYAYLIAIVVALLTLIYVELMKREV